MKKKRSQAKAGPGRGAAGGGKEAAAGGLRLEYVAAGELREHPRNWRRHPESQAAAFRGVLADLGWISPLLMNETTGRLLNGHMRRAAVPAETLVPVLVGRWSEAEELAILATLDPIAGMAEPDAEKVRVLMERVESETPAVQALLEALDAATAKSEAEQDEAGAGGGDGEGEGGGGGGGAREAEIEPVTAVMVRCRDELDWRTLCAALKREGFKVKRAGNV